MAQEWTSILYQPLEREKGKKKVIISFRLEDKKKPQNPKHKNPTVETQNFILLF